MFTKPFRPRDCHHRWPCRG